MTREEKRKEVIKNRISLAAILVEFIVVIVLMVFVVKRLSASNEAGPENSADETVVKTASNDLALPDGDESGDNPIKSADSTGLMNGEEDDATWTPDVIGSLSGDTAADDGSLPSDDAADDSSDAASDAPVINGNITKGEFIDPVTENMVTVSDTDIKAGPSVVLALSGNESQEVVATLSTAAVKAAMYDYDAAIELVKGIDGYESIQAATDAITELEKGRNSLVKWHDNTQISHLFVHSLIVDTSRAFGPRSSQPKGYNQYMTTVSEFNKMIESMYAKGYVLVSMHDIAKVVTESDGTQHLVSQAIMLPEGKIPFVLSQDDVNYYMYMDNNGFADRVVLDENGEPTCQYTEEDGTVKLGEYDMMPIIDRFVREHPDFSYHGHKGILALTGYEGALGYDTGLSMKIYDSLTEDEKMKLINIEREKVTAIADKIKENGWEFASHSYTHSNMTNATVDKMKYDTKRWHEEVEIITGPTDIYIYPYGADICDWRGYKGEKYELLHGAGFWYFCNVDAAQYWIQIRDGYMRMGRINADGERMNVTPERLRYFFDVEEVYDQSRPPFSK